MTYDLFNNAVEHWKSKRCVGTAFIPKQLEDKSFLLLVLNRIYSIPKNKNFKVLVITNTFQERMDIVEYITHQENKENNSEFNHLILSKLLVIVSKELGYKFSFYNDATLVIFYHISDIQGKGINLIKDRQFKLVILNKLLDKQEDNNLIYTECPLLEDFEQNKLDAVRTNTPIEETWIDIRIDEDSKQYKLLKYYNEYIATSMNIFGSFDIMQQCRIGNQSLNISAATLCYNIATDNGWNEHLDMSVELNRQIDNLYNPGNIKARADETFEFIRNRANLLASYDGKLEAILKIVNDNPNKKILIINKKGEFAAKVTEYINTHSIEIICGDYHDWALPKEAVDVDDNPVYFKSGTRKGERKIMGSQYQKALNEKKFNLNKLRVLSTSNAPDKALCINVDIIIITSPLCEEIENYLYRMTNLRFNEKLTLYSLYIKNSLEEQKLNNKQVSEKHKIINKSENNIIVENNSDFVIVD